MVWIEDEAQHIVLVYNGNGENVASKALSIMYGELRGSRRFIIHVVSPKGDIWYLEALRDLINNNIAYTLSIRYHGGAPKDLEELVRRYGDKAVYIIGSDMAEYKHVLKKYGVEPVVIGEVNG